MKWTSLEDRSHCDPQVGISALEMLACDRYANVFRDGHVRQEGRVLMHDRDSELLCSALA